MARPSATFEVLKNGKPVNLTRGIVFQEDLEAAVEAGLRQMKRRIADGMGADGVPLSPYSAAAVSIPIGGVGTDDPRLVPVGGRPSKSGQTMRFRNYASFKSRAGRGTKRNIKASGRLLAMMRKRRARKNRVVVGWPIGSKQEKVAAVHDAKEGGRIFAWSEKEAEIIAKVLDTAIDRRLELMGLTDPGTSVTVKGV